MSKRRDRKADEVDHGQPTGESLDERLDQARDTLGPTVTNIQVTVEAPWKDDTTYAEGEFASKDKLVQDEPLPVEARHWERADFVEKTIVQSPTWTTKQHLVAADSPELNDEAWLIVADENSWLNVGKFKGNDYVEDAKLLYRESDRAMAVEVPDTTEPSITPREALLQEAAGLIVGDRNQSYGEPRQNLQLIADLWNAQLGGKLNVPLTPTDVSLLMIHVKMSRLSHEHKRDSFVDLAGYAAIGWEVSDEAQPK